VDANTGILLGYDSGAVAVLSCSITAGTPTTATVTGTTGRIEFPHGFFHADRFVLHREGREPEEFTAPAASLRYEAEEVMRCLRAGEPESPLVPLDGSLAVMRTLDTVRDRIGVRYAGEA
jgi:predicted dehydrogenase